MAASSFLFAGAVMGRDTIVGWTNIIPTNAWDRSTARVIKAILACCRRYPFWMLKSWIWKSRRQPVLGTLRKTRRRRQRERHQTKGLMSKTMAVHVRYNSLYISLPSSAKQQREMTKFCVVWRTWTTTANFSYFYLELNAFVAYSARTSLNTGTHTG